jgi:hypothetical protein
MGWADQQGTAGPAEEDGSVVSATVRGVSLRKEREKVFCRPSVATCQMVVNFRGVI